MAYGAFTRPRRGDVEAPGDERRRKFERTGIAAAATCIFLLVVAMFVNAHNRRTAAFVAETHSDVVLLACSGINAPRSRTAELLDCDSTREALFRRAQTTERAVLLSGEPPATAALDALDELPDAWDVALFDPDACPKTGGPVRRCLWPDGSNCGEVAYARWAQCEDVSGGAIAGTIAVRGSSAMKVLRGDAADLVAYALIG